MTIRRIIHRAAVRAITGLSDSTLWRRERDGEFPPRVALSPNAVGWYEDEIDAWLASRARRGRQHDESTHASAAA